MQRKNISWVILAGLVALVALALVLAVFLPYAKLKSLADVLMADGNFQSLTENNVIVFKILLGATGLVLLTLAVGILVGRLNLIGIFFRRYFTDFRIFLKNLKPVRIDVAALAAFLVIMAVAIIFRLVRINDGMLHDESYTFMAFSSTTLVTPLTDYHLPNNHVLNSLLIYFSTHLFGIQPWAVRLPALLAGLLLIPATYALAKSIYDKYTALISALLVAILPGAIMYSTSARGYSLVALFTVLTLWLANFLHGSKNLFAWSLLVLFSALGFYSVPVFLFPFGILFAWLFFENLFTSPGEYNSRINFLKYWLLAGFSTAALVLILYTPIFIYTGTGAVFSNQWVTPSAWLGYIPSIPDYLKYAWNEWTNGFSPIWTYALLMGFLLGLVFHRRTTHQRFPLQIAAFVWLTALMLVQRPIGVTKIWAFLQAPFLVWCAAGWMGLFKDLRFKFSRNIPLAAIVTGFAIFIAAISAIKVVPGIPQRWAEKSAEENTALFLMDQLEPQDLIVAAPPYDASIWYYSYLNGVDKRHFSKHLPFDRIFLVYSPTRDQTMMVALQANGLDPDLAVLYNAQVIGNFQFLDIYLLSPH
jgi:hypothetical protein